MFLMWEGNFRQKKEMEEEEEEEEKKNRYLVISMMLYNEVTCFNRLHNSRFILLV